MVDESVVSEHYRHGQLLERIEDGLQKMGKSINCATVEDLAPVDEFHIGGRAATEHLMEQLKFSQSDRLLDVGCGLGGASRFIAKTYGNSVTGIDLTDDYVTVGNRISEWLAIKELVSLHQGSALSMPFDEASFDGAYMLHVGMNIEDKDTLFSQISRVLKSGSKLGIYDIMRTSEGILSYPVPWASDESFSFLTEAEEYTALLEAAGFKIECINNRQKFALEFFKQLKEKAEANNRPPPLGLHLLMESAAPIKITNMIENIVNGFVSPIEIVAQKV